MQSQVKRFLAVMALFMVAACSSNPVSTDYNPQYDFAAIRSYGWLPQTGKNDDPLLYNDLVDERIRRAVDEQLALRGWKKVDKTNADVLITYHLGLKDKVKVDSFYRDFGYYPCYYCRPYGYGYGGYGGYGGPYGGDNITVRQYTEGTLAIDLIDTRNMNMIWRGSLSKAVRTLNSPQERDAAANEVVQQILGNLPTL
jgi:hypothetical protein